MQHLVTLSEWEYVVSFFLKKWANPSLFLFIFDIFSLQFQIEKSVDGVLGIWTRGCRMVGADEITELWRPPTKSIL